MFQSLGKFFRLTLSDFLSGFIPFGLAKTGKFFFILIVIGALAGVCGLFLHYLITLLLFFSLNQITGVLPAEHGEAVAQMWNPSLLNQNIWLLPLIVTFGSLVSSLLSLWGRNSDRTEVKGLRGADATIKVWHEGDTVLKRVPLIVIFASSFLIGFGGSAGVEGPSVQIGHGLGSILGRCLRLDMQEQKLIQAWGVAALVAASFHSPLGGAIFAAEIFWRKGIYFKILPGAFLASFFACLIAGYDPIFSWPDQMNWHWPQLFWQAILLGLLCGLGGRCYVFCLHGTKKIFQRLPLPGFLKPLVGGCLVGIIGIFFPQILGLGYSWLQLGMDAQEAPFIWIFGLVLILPVIKIIATSLSVGSGGLGGVFGPGLIIGGFVGIAFWSFLNFFSFLHPLLPTNPSLFIVIGMAALLGPIARTPFAVIVMVLNLIGNISVTPYVVIAIIAASIISRKVKLYPSQQ